MINPEIQAAALTTLGRSELTSRYSSIEQLDMLQFFSCIGIPIRQLMPSPADDWVVAYQPQQSAHCGEWHSLREIRKWIETHLPETSLAYVGTLLYSDAHPGQIIGELIPYTTGLICKSLEGDHAARFVLTCGPAHIKTAHSEGKFK